MKRTPWLLAGMLGYLAPTTLEAQVFDSPVTVLPQYSIASASADFDLDGRDELVVLYNPASVALLDWQESVGLTITSTTTTISLSAAIAAGDWNGDGFQDTATANTFLRTYSGDGSGGFALSTLTPIGYTPEALLVGDFSGNGIDDVITIGRDLTDVSTLQGSILTLTDIAAHDDARDGVLLDANNDGLLDLTIVEAGGAIKTWLGGSGSLTPSMSTALPGLGAAIHAADLDNDGWQDLAAVEPGIGSFVNGKLITLAGSAAGFSIASSITTGGLGGTSVVIQDMNGDGFKDAAIANSFSTFSILPGFGGLSFGAPHIFAGGSGPGASIGELESGDYDGDGKRDLIAKFGGGLVPIIQREGGDFPGARIWQSSSPPWGQAAIGDFIKDGRSDLMLGISNPGTYSFRGDGKSWFDLLSFLPNVKGQPLIRPMELNGDGHLDMLALDAAAHALRPFFGDGLGAFQEGTTIPLQGTPRDAAVSDFNLDGTADLVVATANASELQIFLGTGLGGFVASSTTPLMDLTHGVRVGDMNGDGREDIVCLTEGALASQIPCGAGDQSDVRVYLVGPGGQVSAMTTETQCGQGSRNLRLADLDGDGALDVSVTRFNSVIFYPGTGSGTVLPPVVMPTDPQGFSTAYADFDADGDPDMVLSTDLGLQYFENTGGPIPSFTQTALFPGAHWSDLQTIDWNSDGRLDVLSSTSSFFSTGAPAWNLLINRSTPQSGLSNFGSSTGGCSGSLGLSANSTPHVGNGAFALAATHAPPSESGYGLIGAPDQIGYAPLNLGILIHVGLTTPFALFPVTSSRDGTSYKKLPIPAIPGLVGQSFAAQMVFPESPGHACGALSGLVTSFGLLITVQP